MYWYIRFFLLVILMGAFPLRASAISSGNIPLDSPVYLYIEKLAGFGLIDSDIKGLRPYSRAEAARLYQEAVKNLKRLDSASSPFAIEILERLINFFPRELSLQSGRDAPIIDYNPFLSARIRYLHLDGIPRDYNRDVRDPGHQSAFGFIGGDLRPLDPPPGQPRTPVHTSGTEGTPLLENNEGVIFKRGENVDLRWNVEVYFSNCFSMSVEPIIVTTPVDTTLGVQKGYLKVGGGGAELEVGRDANWFGPGFRGATVLTNNAKNFDLVKISSPEPLDISWVKEYIGDLKYSAIFSRFDGTGDGEKYRRPYFTGFKLAVKPKPWYEIGVNFARQFDGPGFKENSSLIERIFGGGENDHSNTIAGIDLRFRIPWLRNAEIFAEYSGEDNAGGVWPIVESYVVGFHVPCLTSSGRDDLRFEYFWGSVMLYGDWQFPAGYVYHNMTPGHSQGTAAQDFFVRYSHWFSARNNLALEYFHTDRGKYGKMPSQVTEYKNAGRIFWRMPLYGEVDTELMYGYEQIDNLNLVQGVDRHNQLFKVDISYRH